MQEIISRHSYYAVVNFAAESHVDRGIVSPADFIHSNVVGTTVLLEPARDNGVNVSFRSLPMKFMGPMSLQFHRRKPPF